jgi:hypothetical protein
MYKIIPWSKDLDLTDFYARAASRGFANNANESVMIDCLRNEDKWQVWILYYNNIAIGSVASHSMEEGYRICTRTCILTDYTDKKGLRGINNITKHQNLTAQFLIPECIKWAKEPMYITSHPSNVGTQQLVHNIWGPSLVKTGVLTRAFEKEYRGHIQTFWKLNVEVFQEQLEKVKWI